MTGSAGGDGVRLDPSSLAELERLGRAFKGADKVLQKHLRANLRESVRPITDAVIREGAAGLGARGGLRARASQVGRDVVRTDVSRGSIRLTFAFTDRAGDSLAAFDRGEFYHPVFGRWVKGMPAQRTAPHRFTQAFLREKTHVQIRTQAALEQTAAELARKA